MQDSSTDRQPRPPVDQAANAARARAEADARHAELDARLKAAAAEKGGRGGLDPARYGDWEIKGIAADF